MHTQAYSRRKHGPVKDTGLNLRRAFEQLDTDKVRRPRWGRGEGRGAQVLLGQP